MLTDKALKQIRELIPAQWQSRNYVNVNDLQRDSMTFGQKVADGVARNMGSWRFIIIQSALLVGWLTLNVVLAVHEYSIFGANFRAWDVYPFILLNLALSFQAAYSAPIIMMSQNRQADKDRLAAEHDYHVNIRSEATVMAVLDHLKAQDEVILAILRQLEEIHNVVPSDEQRKAEAELAEVTKSEDAMLRKTIAAEESEAGLGAQAAG